MSKACKHTKVTFIWDGDVIAREITERPDRVDVVDWFFEPGSFRPLARLEAGDLTFVINDHLGTPKEVVGGDGSLRWSADHDTWGTLRTKRGSLSAPIETGDYWIEPTSINENTAKAYAPGPDAIFCPIRFQGQWEDAETGLYYNHQRYYDPNSIQYISTDPLGFHGGINANAYVPFPTIWLDPHGLSGLYMFQTAAGNCYVGIGPESRWRTSEGVRTGNGRYGDGSGAISCCGGRRASQWFNPESIGTLGDYTPRQMQLLVEQSIMYSVDAVPDTDWLNRANTGRSLYADAQSRGYAGRIDRIAERYLSDFRTNAPGTVC